MPLINCEINPILSWPKKHGLLSNDTKATTFTITDIKLYVLTVTLSTQDNAKLFQQSKLGFKRTINWNKCQSKVSTQVPKPYLDYLIDPSFQGGNKLLVLSFENTTERALHTKYCFTTMEIKDCNVIIDGQNVFNQPVKINLRTYDYLEKLQLFKEMITQLGVY